METAREHVSVTAAREIPRVCVQPTAVDALFQVSRSKANIEGRNESTHSGRETQPGTKSRSTHAVRDYTTGRSARDLRNYEPSEVEIERQLLISLPSWDQAVCRFVPKAMGVYGKAN